MNEWLSLFTLCERIEKELPGSVMLNNKIYSGNSLNVCMFNDSLDN